MISMDCFVGFHNLKARQYEFFRKTAVETEWVRLAAPLVTLSTALLSLAEMVSLVVEPIILGLGNIFGALLLCSDSCDVIQGLKLITGGVLAGSLVALLVAVITAIEVPFTLFGVAIAPKTYLEYLTENMPEIKSRY